MSCGRANALEDGGQVEGQRGMPFLQGKLNQWRLNRRASGIIHPDIQLAEVVDGRLREIVDGVLIGHIGGDRHRAATGLVDLPGHLLDLMGSPCGADDAGPRLRQYFCYTSADTAAGAGDDGNVAIEIEQVLRHVCAPL